jgi:hypothetical protein
MVNDFLRFLLHLALDVLNRVLAYLIHPLPKWQVQLVRGAAAVSTIAAVTVWLNGASVGQSMAPFFLLLLASRPLPARGRWKFGLVMVGMFLLVGGIPLSYL